MSKKRSGAAPETPPAKRAVRFGTPPRATGHATQGDQSDSDPEDAFFDSFRTATHGYHGSLGQLYKVRGPDGTIYRRQLVYIVFHWSKNTKKEHYAAILQPLLSPALWRTYFDPGPRSQDVPRVCDMDLDVTWIQERNADMYLCPQRGLQSSRPQCTFGSWVISAKTVKGMRLLTRMAPLVSQAIERQGDTHDFRVIRFNKAETKAVTRSLRILQGLESPPSRSRKAGPNAPNAAMAATFNPPATTSDGGSGAGAGSGTPGRFGTLLSALP